MSWANDEFEHVSLGDQRLNKRVVKIAERRVCRRRVVGGLRRRLRIIFSIMMG
jgi:hypothetical protein